MFELQDIGITPAVILHICDRSPESFDVIRKFIAGCGTKFEVRLTKRKKVRSIEPVDNCRYGKDCPQCAKQIAKIREIIAAGR
jgi:hypothetical protein